MFPSDTFEILKLPQVAQKNIIQSMSPFQQITFSFCSKRSKATVKTVKLRYRILFWVKKKLFVTISASKTRNFKFSAIAMKNRFNMLDCSLISKPLIIRWKAWTDYLCDIFKTQIFALRISEVQSLETLKELNDWIRNRQNYLEYFEIFTKDSLPKEYLQILIDTFTAKNIYINNCIDVKYEFNVAFMSEKLQIRLASWFDIRNLMMAQCTKIDMDLARLSCKNLNTFMKEWMKGSIPNLLYFVTLAASFDFPDLMNGIDVVNVEEERQIKHKYEGIFGGIEEINGGKEIRRLDGVVATIEGRLVPFNYYNEFLLDFFGPKNITSFKLISNSLFLTAVHCSGKEIVNFIIEPDAEGEYPRPLI